MKKKASGSHLNRNNTDHAEIAPSTIHSENGSKKVAIGHIAERNLVHL